MVRGLPYPEGIHLSAYEDGVAEESEGFVLYLDLVESELDPRDVGLVNISRNTYLIRINESGIVHFNLIVSFSYHPSRLHLYFYYTIVMAQ